MLFLFSNKFKIMFIFLRCGFRTGEPRKSGWRRMRVDIAGLSSIKVSSAAEVELKWKRKVQQTTRDSVTVSWASEVCMCGEPPPSTSIIYYRLRERFLKGNCQSSCLTNEIKGTYRPLKDTFLHAAEIRCVILAFHLFILCCFMHNAQANPEQRAHFTFFLRPPYGRWRIPVPPFIGMMELFWEETGSLAGCKRHRRHPYVI